MVLSVGGTPAPLVTSILAHRPAFVSFLASQRTCEDVIAVRAEASGRGHRFESEITLADDVNDLLHCYAKAEEAVGRVFALGYRRENVVVDYTGGTKNMSMALALASVSHAFSFAYVGGNDRTKEGKGVVVDGSERVFRGVNPWDFLAVEERRTASLLFNRCQFRAAREVLEGLARKTPLLRARFRPLVTLVDGYHQWDLFNYTGALEAFRKARLPDLATLDDAGIQRFAVSSLPLFHRLEELAGWGRRPGLVLLGDMFANAERRPREGKPDDALLRLYRFVEMVAQERLLARYQIDASNVPRERIPESLGAGYAERHLDPRDNKIKIPQSAAFQLLAALGDEIGASFTARAAEFAKLQSARNSSFLAHGYDAAEERTYSRLREFALSLVGSAVADGPRFPEMELSAESPNECL